MSITRELNKVFCTVIPIRTEGTATPLIFIHGVGGDLPNFTSLLDKLDPSHPVYGLQSQAFDPLSAPLLTLKEIAAYQLEELRQVLPKQQYNLIGFSFGGMVAYEMAQQLRSRGGVRPSVFMIDSSEMSRLKRRAKEDSIRQRATDLYQRLWRRSVEALQTRDSFSYVWEKITSRTHRMFYSITSRAGLPPPPSVHNPYHVNWFAAVNYQPLPYDERFYLFKAKDHFWEPRTPADLGWGPLAVGGLEVFAIPGDHTNLFTEPSVTVLAQELTKCLVHARH